MKSTNTQMTLLFLFLLGAPCLAANHQFAEHCKPYEADSFPLRSLQEAAKSHAVALSQMQFAMDDCDAMLAELPSACSTWRANPQGEGAIHRLQNARNRVGTHCGIFYRLHAAYEKDNNALQKILREQGDRTLCMREAASLKLRFSRYLHDRRQRAEKSLKECADAR